MAVVAGPLMLAASMGLILNWTDILMLGAMGSEVEVGQYSIAVRLAMLTTLMLRSVNAAVGPRFAEAWQRNDVKWLNKEVQHSNRMIFWSSLPILVMFVLAPDFFLGFFGDEFSAARIALMLLSVGMFVSSISGSVGVFMQMTGCHVAFQNISFITVFLNVGMNAVLIPLYGITGAAIASMLAMIFRNLFSVFFIYRKFGILTIYLPFMKTARG
jgi:O-antigen/teichoic acid export membrane protein